MAQQDMLVSLLSKRWIGCPAPAAPHTSVCLDIDGNVPSLPILLGAELVAGAWGEELCLLKPPYGLSAISYSDCTDLLWLARWGPWSPPGSWGSQMGAEVPATRCSSLRAAPALLCWDAEPAWDWAGDRSGARGFPGWHSLKKKSITEPYNFHLLQRSF